MLGIELEMLAKNSGQILFPKGIFRIDICWISSNYQYMEGNQKAGEGK
jgi:hypothetical protein